MTKQKRRFCEHKWKEIGAKKEHCPMCGEKVSKTSRKTKFYDKRGR